MCQTFLTNVVYLLYTLRRISSFHCISSSMPAIQLCKDSSTLTEMKIYSGMSWIFWECTTFRVSLWYNIFQVILLLSTKSWPLAWIALFFRNLPTLGKFRKNNLKLSRPRFNFGAKQKSELQNFVLEGHPNYFTIHKNYNQHGSVSHVLNKYTLL